jgi:hypothetical protein
MVLDRLTGGRKNEGRFVPKLLRENLRGNL